MFEKSLAPLLGIADIKNALMKVAGSHKFWKTPFSAEPYHGKLHPPDQEPRSMQDSYSRVAIPLSNPEFRERYLNSLNQIRFGRLLEDLDCLAGYIAYKHNNVIIGEKVLRAGFSIVTASVDRIISTHSPLPNVDVEMSGFVSWVGRSSMETTMHMEQIDHDKVRRLATARFVMVAIDPSNKMSTPVSRLHAKTPEEKTLLNQGDRNRSRRVRLSESSLFRQAPNEEESSLIHDLYLSTLDPAKHSFKERTKPSDDVWMKDTSLKSLIICHPEYRNIHNHIFGGFLMRQALELAWAEAWAFSRSRPYCVAVDDIIFRLPVNIGSMLWLHMSIGYTDYDLLQTRVTAEVSDPSDPTRRELTNIFHFTFRAPLHGEREALPRIFPDSYGEAMLFLDSRRRLMAIKPSLHLPKHEPYYHSEA